MKKRTDLLRGGNARAYMKYLKNTGIPFEMFVSNYTAKFKTELFERKFVHNMQSNRAFACFAKLKSDLKDKPIPDIDQDKLSYFVHNFKQDIQHANVTNIDLKSAYATVLYNDGYISKATMDYISKGTKQDRLVSVGMLASKKQYFKFDTGKIIQNDEIISPTSNFFFYAVRRTSEIMDDLKVICGNRYLFTWVDGIYFIPDMEVEQACKAYIEAIGFKSSCDDLTDFRVRITKKHVAVNFNKDGKPKPFNLPIPGSEFKRLMVEAILSKKR